MEAGIYRGFIKNGKKSSARKKHYLLAFDFLKSRYKI